MQPSDLSLHERFADLGADGAPARLGVMGGTFDPIHMGHLRMAEEVREALGLDGVLFVPAGNPVFKKGIDLADGQERLRTVADAVADNPRFDASAVEVRREGDTFTIDTLRQLREAYPENVELVLIVGDDAAQLMDKWREGESLAEYARIAVATGRPGGGDDEVLRAKLEALAPGCYDLVPVTALDIASHDIRERQREGRSVRYLVPEAARAVAKPWFDEAGELRAGDVGKALSKEFLEARRAELEERVGPKRFEHSLNVSKTAKELARLYDVDPKRARLAGLLHDWDKGMDDDQARARVAQLAMEDALDPAVVQDMPRVLHGHTAAWALAREFSEIPGDVLQAIDRHTVAAEDMDPLDMVVYIADAIEPGRQFGAIDELREAVGKVDLQELFLRTYEYWTYLLLERRRTLHPDTIRIWNSYASKLGRKKGTRHHDEPAKK